jgi:serine/threonine protein kinase
MDGIPQPDIDVALLQHQLNMERTRARGLNNMVNNFERQNEVLQFQLQASQERANELYRLLDVAQNQPAQMQNPQPPSQPPPQRHFEPHPFLTAQQLAPVRTLITSNHRIDALQCVDKVVLHQEGNKNKFQPFVPHGTDRMTRQIADRLYTEMTDQGWVFVRTDEHGQIYSLQPDEVKSKIVINGDLKAANILVDNRFCDKVADFGLPEEKAQNVQLRANKERENRTMIKFLVMWIHLLALQTLQYVVPVASANAELWAMKSRLGGGYAGKAAYDPIHEELVMTGTVWDSEFLYNWEIKGGYIPTKGSILANSSKCFIHTIGLANAKLSDSHSWEPPNSCGALTLLRAFSENSLKANPTDTLNQVHVIQDTSVLMMGYELVTDQSSQDQTLRVQQAMSLINLQSYATREQEMQATSPTIDFTAIDRPSLYDLLSGYPPLPQGVSQDYQHQSLPFTYAMSVVAERSMKESISSEYPSPMGEAQNVFVAITQSEQIPLFFNKENTKAQTAGQIMSSIERVFYYQQVANMDKVQSGHSSFELGVPTIGGVQKIDAASGILKWYTQIAGEEGYEGDVMVSHVVYAPDTRYGEFVLVAGSTKGASGPLLGTDVNRPVRGGSSDWDGFITKLDAQTGERYMPLSGHDASYRIKSTGNENDWVTDICFQQPDIAFIVGSTTGKIASNHLDEDGGAFVIKMDIDTMEIIWQMQFEGLGVLGTSCTIAEVEPAVTSSQKNLLYVGGVLPPSHPGFDMDGNKKNSAGNAQFSRTSEDAFVIAIDVDNNNGQIEWIREIQYEQEFNPSGLQRHESIASLSLDSKNHHVIAYGNSYDPLEEVNDLFAVALDGQSGMAGGLAGTTFQRTSDSVSPTSPVVTPTEAPTQPLPTPLDTTTFPEEGASKDKKLVLVVAIVVPASLLFVGILIIVCCRRNQSLQKEDKSTALDDLRLDERMEVNNVFSTEHSNAEDHETIAVDPDPAGVSKQIV